MAEPNAPKSEKQDQQEIAATFLDFISSGDDKKAIASPQGDKAPKTEEKKEEEKKPEDKKEEEKVDFDLGDDKKKADPPEGGWVPSDEEVERQERERKEKEAKEGKKDKKEDEEEIDEKNPKPGQIQALRKSRDEARDELGKAKEQIAKLTQEAENGGLTEEQKTALNGRSVEQVVQEADELKSKLEKVEKGQDELKAKLRSVNIENDPDFVEKYNQPIIDGLNGLTAMLADVDADGNVLFPEHIEKLKNKLLNFDGKGNVVGDALQVKAAFKGFAEAYEKATGEKFNAPDPSQVMASVRSLVKMNQSRSKAIQQWEVERKDAEADNLKRSQAREAERAEALKKNRIAQSAKAVENFNYDSVKLLGDQTEVKEMLQTAASDLEEMLETPDKQPSWEDMVYLRFKANQFDALLKIAEKGKPDDDDDGHHGGAENHEEEEEKKDDFDWMAEPA